MPITGLRDISGSIDVGATAQDAVGANPGRTYLLIQNIDPSEDMWVNVIGDDAQPDIVANILLKAAGGSVVWENNAVPGGRVSVVAATANHAWTALEG